MVRSKSELVIANHLFDVGLPYLYERPLEGTISPGRLRPDFSFVTDAGDVIVWEHLGMLDCDDYRRGWEWKWRGMRTMASRSGAAELRILGSRGFRYLQNVWWRGFRAKSCTTCRWSTPDPSFR